MVGEIAERCGFDIDECKEAIASLLADGRIEKNGATRGTRYSVLTPNQGVLPRS
jgi:hypothetical protein